jgi:lactate permease
MIWTQNYDPVGSAVLSTLLAALPVIVLLGLLGSGKLSAHAAAVAGLVTAFLLAVFVFVPVEAKEAGHLGWAQTMFAAAVNGALFGLFPIGWIVLAAIFLYSLTVHSGHFEIVKESVVNLSADRRIQALLIAFSFGAFIEGAAGFGTPVAISAALMMGAGFKPLHAAGLALIANTSPVAFGALGTPILTLARVTGLSELDLSAMAGRQLPFFSLIVPAWLVWTMAGWRATWQIWPALLVCGGSFAAVQFLVANFHGPWLVDVAGGVISLVALALFLKVWQPRTIWKFAEERVIESEPPKHTRGQVVSAWMPWALLTTFVFLWGIPQIKTKLGVPDKATRDAFQKGPDQVMIKPTYFGVKVPLLHLRVARVFPVVREPEKEPAIYEFGWLAGTGTSIFLAAIMSAIWLRIPMRTTFRIFGETCYRVRWPMFTIACMLALAFTTRYSGLDATLGLAFTKTGFIYPLFAALLGWLGVALTGSDTSSNALFGSLQTITARRLVADNVLPLTEAQAMLLMAAANSTGGVMGKMIDAQSIVVAAVATGQHNQESAILRFVFWHSIALAILMGVLIMIQAYWWTGSIPT